MKIKKLEASIVEIPMITSFTTSFGTVTRKPTVIVKVTNDKGTIGYGEGAALPFPFYKPDTTQTTMLALKEYVMPLVTDKEFKTVEELMELLKPIKGHAFAKTAIETAIWMILSLESNKPLSVLLGGTREKIGVGESIGIHTSIEETLEEISLRIDQGFQRMKVKTKPGWDVKLIKAIRAKFGDFDLMVDANSSYTLEDLPVLKELDGYNLMMTEQPLADDDIIDHATLQKQIATPVCLDESILSAEDARKAVEIGACKIINIKPGRVGGLLESKKIHDYCLERGIGVWGGGMLETGIGRAFNIAVASLPNYIYPADMSPVHFFYKDDLVKESFIVDNKGFITVPTTPGLGYEIDEDKIKTYTTDSFTA
jgi:O-succinylbenzoate synthase